MNSSKLNHPDLHKSYGDLSQFFQEITLNPQENVPSYLTNTNQIDQKINNIGKETLLSTHNGDNHEIDFENRIAKKRKTANSSNPFYSALEFHYHDSTTKNSLNFSTQLRTHIKTKNLMDADENALNKEEAALKDAENMNFNAPMIAMHSRMSALFPHEFTSKVIEFLQPKHLKYFSENKNCNFKCVSLNNHILKKELIDAFAEFHQVCALKLHNTTLDDTLLRYLSQKLTTLQRLDIFRSKITGESFERLPQSLCALTLDDCRVSLENLKKIPINITALALLNCHAPTENILWTLPRHLERLDLSLNQMSDENFAALYQFTQLKELRICNNALLTNKFFAYVPKTVEIIKLHYCPQIALTDLQLCHEWINDNGRLTRVKLK